MQEFKLPEFTKNPNVVANMSTQEYFERKCKELRLEHFPKIDFVAMPVIHIGSNNALEVVDIAKKNDTNILLIEDAAAYVGDKNKLKRSLIEATRKEGINFNPSDFYKEIFNTATKANITVDTYEHKRLSLKEVEIGRAHV